MKIEPDPDTERLSAICLEHYTVFQAMKKSMGDGQDPITLLAMTILCTSEVPS